jgi:hypothetical protein
MVLGGCAFPVAALLGNIVGGTALFALLAYAQVDERNPSIGRTGWLGRED